LVLIPHQTGYENYLLQKELHQVSYGALPTEENSPRLGWIINPIQSVDASAGLLSFFFGSRGGPTNMARYGSFSGAGAGAVCRRWRLEMNWCWFWPLGKKLKDELPTGGAWFGLGTYGPGQATDVTRV
jgi:hypothetical protein